MPFYDYKDVKRSRGDAPVAAVAPAPFPLRLSWPLPW